MPGRYKPYTKYKDSNVEWIDSVPEHWKASYLGFECSVKARLGWKGLKAEEYVDDGYVFLATPNIKDNEVDFININRITKERYDESPEIILEKGDVLVTKDGSTTGTTNIIRVLPEPATVNSSIAVLRSKGNVLSEYLYYFFVSEYTQNLIIRMRGGMGVPHLFQADLRKFYILVPAKQEQGFIVNFLDHETTKIDIFIEKQKQLIQLLKEKRQAVISHTVTKGLSPKAKMRDSGVRWLGEVPEHWGIGKIKNLSSIISKGTTPSTMGEKFETTGIRFLKAENIGKGFYVAPLPEFYISEKTDKLLSRSRLQSKDVLVIIAGATTGLSSVIQEDLLPANTNQAVSFIRPLNNAYSEYISYWLSTEYAQSNIWQVAVQAAQPNLSMESLGNIYIPIPPENETKELITHINFKLSKLAVLIENAKLAINLMQERRAALISASVTGKIDVRNWIAPKETQTNKEVAA